MMTDHKSWWYCKHSHVYVVSLYHYNSWGHDFYIVKHQMAPQIWLRILGLKFPVIQARLQAQQRSCHL